MSSALQQDTVTVLSNSYFAVRIMQFVTVPYLA